MFLVSKSSQPPWPDALWQKQWLCGFDSALRLTPKTSGLGLAATLSWFTCVWNRKENWISIHLHRILLEYYNLWSRNQFLLDKIMILILICTEWLVLPSQLPSLHKIKFALALLKIGVSYSCRSQQPNLFCIWLHV